MDKSFIIVGIDEVRGPVETLAMNVTKLRIPITTYARHRET